MLGVPAGGEAAAEAVSEPVNYTCPICGWDQLDAPFEAWHICPCCGNEAEYDDATRSHLELREAWIAKGCPWFSTFTPVPDGWDPEAQLQQVVDET